MLKPQKETCLCKNIESPNLDMTHVVAAVYAVAVLLRVLSVTPQTLQIQEWNKSYLHIIEEPWLLSKIYFSTSVAHTILVLLGLLPHVKEIRKPNVGIRSVIHCHTVCLLDL